VRPKHVVLVHGDFREMTKLNNKLEELYQDEDLSVYMPANACPMSLVFTGTKTAKVVGTLAEEAPAEGQQLAGVLLSKDFEIKLVNATDLNEYSALQVGEIEQNLEVPYQQGWQKLVHYISQMYEPPRELSIDRRPAVSVLGAVNVICSSSQTVNLTWSADPVKDMVADSLVCLIQQVEDNSAMFPAPSQPDPPLPWRALLESIIAEQYGKVTVDGDTISFEVDGQAASVMCRPDTQDTQGKVEVSTTDPVLQARLEATVRAASLVVQSAKMPVLQTGGNRFVKGEVLAPEVTEIASSATIPVVSAPPT